MCAWYSKYIANYRPSPKEIPHSQKLEKRVTEIFDVLEKVVHQYKNMRHKRKNVYCDKQVIFLSVYFRVFSSIV